MIDQFTIDKIYEAAEIVDVISDFVSLKRKGINYVGLCPFHNEKTPSFTVSPSKGIYKCFGCGKGGNSVNFIMEHENLSYYEALRFLAKKYNIEIHEKEETQEDKEKKDERENLLVVTSFASKFFHDTLLNSNEGQNIGLSYLHERGIRDDMIEKFQIGYSPEKKDALTEYAISKGYKREYLVKSGLTIEKNNQYFDRFSHRIIFPIHSIGGQVIGFGGRSIKTTKEIAKYLNSPDSDIYHKSFILYGIFQAKKAIVQNDKCFLTEGYTDVISFHQAGIENVVASSGTSLTSEQIRLIKRFTNNITIVYDGDQAGIKAAIRGIDMVLEEGMNVKVVLLPDGEDPDSFSRKNAASEVIKFINENETDFILFKTRLLISEAQKDPIKKATLITDIVHSLAVIPDQIVRSIYIKECSGLLQVSEQILYAEINRQRRKILENKYKTPLPSEQIQIKEVLQPLQIIKNYDCTLHEKEIIRLLLNYGNYIIFEGFDVEGKDKWIMTVSQYIISELMKDEIEFKDPIFKRIFEEYTRFYFNDSEMANEYFIRHSDKEINAVAADLLSKRYTLSKKLFQRNNSNVAIETEETKLSELVPSVVLDFKNRKILSLLNELNTQLLKAQEDNDEMKIMELQSQIQNLNEIKKNLAESLGYRTILP